MRISQIDGTLMFASGSVGSTLDRESFLKSQLAVRARAVARNRSWLHYNLQPEPSVAATLLFDGNRLDRVFVQLAMPHDASDQWSVQGELDRKTQHDEWLMKELGKPPYSYDWGHIESCYDDRGCSSDIIVTYGR